MQEGGEHALSGEVTKAKMPHQPRQAGNLQQGQGSLPISEHPSPFMPTWQQGVLPKGPLKASLTLRWHKGTNNVCPRETPGTGVPHHRHLAPWGLPKEASNRSHVMSRMFFLRESFVYLGARMAEWVAPFGQPALSPTWEPGPCPQTVCSQRKCGA